MMYEDIPGKVENENGGDKSGDQLSLPWADVRDFPPQWLDPDNAYVRVGSYAIDVSDRESLVGTSWITDNIINPFVAFQFYQDSFEGKDKVEVFQSHALKSVTYPGSTFCKHILLQRDILKKVWIIPNNAGGAHWNLFIVLPMEKTIIILDSITSGHFVRTDEVRRLMQIIHMAFTTQQGNEPVWEEWLFKAPTNIQDQENSYDCGVHVMVWAYIIASGRGDLRLPVSEDSAAARMWIAWVLFEADKKGKPPSPKRSVSSLSWPSNAVPKVSWEPKISRSPLPGHLNPECLVARLLRSEAVDENFNSISNSSTLHPHCIAPAPDIMMENYEKTYTFNDSEFSSEGSDSSAIESPSCLGGDMSLLSIKMMQQMPVRPPPDGLPIRTSTKTTNLRRFEGIATYSHIQSRRREKARPRPGLIVTSTPSEQGEKARPRPGLIVTSTPSEQGEKARPRPGLIVTSTPSEQGEKARPRPGLIVTSTPSEQGEKARPRPGLIVTSTPSEQGEKARPRPGLIVTSTPSEQGEEARPRPESFSLSATYDSTRRDKAVRLQPGRVQSPRKRRSDKLAEELCESDDPQVKRLIRDVIWNGRRASEKHFMTRIGKGLNLKMSAMYSIILKKRKLEAEREKCKMCNARIKYSSLRKLHEKNCIGRKKRK